MTLSDTKLWMIFCPSIFQASLDQKQDLTSAWKQAVTSPCCKFVKNDRLYNTNIDLVNDKVYTKFGQILYIHSQDIEQKPISDIYQGP